MARSGKKLDPIPPGEILLEEFMVPHGVSQNRLARDIGVNPARVNDIVHGRSAITAAIALRLGKYFGTTPSCGSIYSQTMTCGGRAPPNGPKIEPRVRILAANR